MKIAKVEPIPVAYPEPNDFNATRYLCQSGIGIAVWRPSDQWGLPGQRQSQHKQDFDAFAGMQTTPRAASQHQFEYDPYRGNP